MNSHKRRSIIYSIVAVLLLVALCAILWTTLGNKTTQISELYFREHINEYTKIKVNIYNVICQDAQGRSYTFALLDRAGFIEFLEAAMAKGKVDPTAPDAFNKELLDHLDTNYYAADPNATSWTDYICLLYPSPSPRDSSAAP